MPTFNYCVDELQSCLADLNTTKAANAAQIVKVQNALTAMGAPFVAPTPAAGEDEATLVQAPVTPPPASARKGGRVAGFGG